MWLPPLALLMLSYAVRPVFIERYLIASFVPFFMLSAIGIMQLPSSILRIAAGSLAVILSLGHTYAWSRKPHDTQWREGLVIALAADHGGQPIAVAPSYAINVVRYYMPFSGEPIALVEADPSETGGDVLLLSDQSKGESAARLVGEFPHVIGHPRGLEVRGR
jgi:hypothetical protein